MIALPLLFGSLGWPEIVLIVLVVLIFFGAKRIPDLMKSLGKGVKSFKQGINEIDDQINQAVEDADKQPAKIEKTAEKKEN